VAQDDITRLLIDLGAGKREAQNALVPLVYEQLRAMAHRRLASSPPNSTLDTTALVHEAYLKLFDQTQLTLHDRRHFFSVAAMAMRQIVVDHARQRQALKRGGGVRPLDLENHEVGVDDHAPEILSLEAALQRLSALSERLGRVVELRFFGGLSVEEVADVLGVDPRTVKRDWRKARALLYRELAEPESA
jgi:RNA polymerase sigma factor (TIGR02999 family)